MPPTASLTTPPALSAFPQPEACCHRSPCQRPPDGAFRLVASTFNSVLVHHDAPPLCSVPCLSLGRAGVRLPVLPAKGATRYWPRCRGGPCGSGLGPIADVLRVKLKQLPPRKPSLRHRRVAAGAGQGKAAPVLKVGTWHHFGAFDDVRVNAWRRARAHHGFNPPRWN